MCVADGTGNCIQKRRGIVIKRMIIDVNGIVQGVGFRPFIYQIAHLNQLKGLVHNNSRGVEIDVEGEEKHIDRFINKIWNDAPPLARIVNITSQEKPLHHYETFLIDDSRDTGPMRTFISPDVSVCDDCLRELQDPGDRRYRYPFINCTNCGPRYTIIEDIPYDRPNTTMKEFIQCPECKAEYDNPFDRRFHAQPNACPVCGPKVQLFTNKREEIAADDPVKSAVELLKQGKIIAVKGLGGFHIVCDAENSEAVELIRNRKRHEEKPLALMVPSLKTIEKFAFITPLEQRILMMPERPILLFPKKKPNTLSESVAPRNNCYGIMLPYTPLHHLLLENNFTALIATSGNISEEPIAIDNEEAFARLGNLVDYILLHNRRILIRTDDSVYRCFRNVLYPIRRSRGFVPLPIFLQEEFSPLLACGAELKNTICLTSGGNAFVSQHIGDMENLQTFQFFEETIDHLKKILEVEPEVIAYDLHPDYLSTRYALQQNHLRQIGVQHHHAHIVSCMAEHGINERVIGLALDGTGYGLDGHIWGGEVLIADLKEFQRAAHMDYIPMPGGDKAVREPWRMAVSYLYKVYGDDLYDLDIPFITEIDLKKLKILLQMLDKKFNSPLTSSCGRIFDAVASIVGLRNVIRYEGQAAMELEHCIEGRSDDCYRFELIEKDSESIISYEELFREIVYDIQNKVSRGIISIKFHNALVDILKRISLLLRNRYNINSVVMSGGCFQNIYLLSRLKDELEGEAFRVLHHTQVPANDGGISLGQAVIAGSKINLEKN